MKITYQNGTLCDALLLSHGEDTLRAAVPGHNGVRTFHRAGGAWLSEECEPVTFEFAWQHTPVPEAPIEDDCVCSKRLASRLISMLLSGGQEEPGANLLYVFSAAGNRVRIHQSQLVA